MKFLFTYESGDEFSNVKLTTSTAGVGNLIIRKDEWDALKSILTHGRTWFQRNEVEVLFKDKTSTPAFVEGGK